MKLWRGQPDQDYRQMKFTPRERAMVWWGLGAMSLVMAWSKWAYPSAPPFTGKLGWLMGWMHGNLGPKGPAIAFLVAGAACLIAGLLVDRKE